MRCTLPVLALLLLAGCASDCGAPTRTVAALPPAALAAPAPCASCAGGACAVPLAAPAALPIVGDYGIELGRPGVEEHARAALAVPPAVAGCLVTGAYEVLMAAVKAANCAAASLIPTPAASQRLVRLQVVERAQAPAPKGCGK